MVLQRAGAGPHTDGGDHPGPDSRGGADSQCRRYAKFVALTNQALSRPSTLHRTNMVRAVGSLHQLGAKCGAIYGSSERDFTAPLDLGASTCLRVD